MIRNIKNLFFTGPKSPKNLQDIEKHSSMPTDLGDHTSKSLKNGGKYSKGSRKVPQLLPVVLGDSKEIPLQADNSSDDNIRINLN